MHISFAEPVRSIANFICFMSLPVSSQSSLLHVESNFRFVPWCVLVSVRIVALVTVSLIDDDDDDDDSPDTVNADTVDAKLSLCFNALQSISDAVSIG